MGKQKKKRNKCLTVESTKFPNQILFFKFYREDLMSGVTAEVESWLNYYLLFFNKYFFKI